MGVPDEAYTDVHAILSTFCVFELFQNRELGAKMLSAYKNEFSADRYIFVILNVLTTFSLGIIACNSI